MTLDRVVAKLEALRLFLHEQREFLVDSAIQRSVAKAKEYDINVEKRVSYKKRMPGEEARDIGLSLQGEIRRGMLECTDRFYEELVTRSNAMNKIAELFKAVSPSSLIDDTEDQLKISVKALCSFYDEVSETDLLLEIPRLRRHLRKD